MFCQNFMRVIKQLRCEDDSGKQRLAVLVYAYIGVRLRESVSLFSRIDITAEEERSKAYCPQETVREKFV